jgi:hypothetical protein
MPLFPERNSWDYGREHFFESPFFKLLRLVRDRRCRYQVVHQAPAFGRLSCVFGTGHSEGSDIPCPVDADGNFTDPVEPVKGIHVKAADPTLIQLMSKTWGVNLRRSRS